jgi:predicted acylesterase/phospholipase RssA
MAGKDGEVNPERTQVALVIGAGAPNATLMAGALCLFCERGVTFDIVFTSGAGGLLGLLYMAPKGKTPVQALQDTINFGVSDLIYNLFPFGYKTFFKAGPFTELFTRWGQYIPRFPLHFSERHHNARQRLYNDWVDWWVAALTPTNLHYGSAGLTTRSPFIDELIDFTALRNAPGEFYMNAFSLTDNTMVRFDKEVITKEHFYATMAFPFIYPPYEMNGQFYIEGGVIDPLNFANLPHPETIKAVVVFDVLKNYLLRRPRNIWDAYQISIVTPIVSLADKALKDFQDATLQRQSMFRDIELRRISTQRADMDFDIPEEQYPYLLEWSYSNLLRLWEIGYRAGARFYEQYGQDLPHH